MEKLSWLKRFLSDEYADDVKRAVFLALSAVHIIVTFLLMYFKIEIANKSLVSECISWNGWLIIATGGLVAVGPALAKWKPGTPANIVTQEVESQTINTDKGVVIQEKNEPLKE